MTAPVAPTGSSGVMPGPSHPWVIESPRNSNGTGPAIARETFRLCWRTQPWRWALGAAIVGPRGGVGGPVSDPA